MAENACEKGEDEIFHQGALMDAYKELKCGQELCLMPCSCSTVMSILFILQKYAELKVHENNLKIPAFINSMYTNAYGRSALISQNFGTV